MEIFINHSFVKKHYINIYKLFKPVPVFNINSILNKNSQISKIVDIFLYYYYQLYFQQVLLIVLSLNKQNLILGLIWLKNHNFKVNWKKKKWL